jgi:hypothetical protein
MNRAFAIIADFVNIKIANKPGSTGALFAELELEPFVYVNNLEPGSDRSR